MHISSNLSAATTHAPGAENRGDETQEFDFLNFFCANRDPETESNRPPSPDLETLDDSSLLSDEESGNAVDIPEESADDNVKDTDVAYDDLLAPADMLTAEQSRKMGESEKPVNAHAPRVSPAAIHELSGNSTRQQLAMQIDRVFLQITDNPAQIPLTDGRLNPEPPLGEMQTHLVLRSDGSMKMPGVPLAAPSSGESVAAPSLDETDKSRSMARFPKQGLQEALSLVTNARVGSLAQEGPSFASEFRLVHATDTSFDGRVQQNGVARTRPDTELTVSGAASSRFENSSQMTGKHLQLPPEIDLPQRSGAQSEAERASLDSKAALHTEPMLTRQTRGFEGPHKDNPMPPPLAPQNWRQSSPTSHPPLSLHPAPVPQVVVQHKQFATTTAGSNLKTDALFIDTASPLSALLPENRDTFAGQKPLDADSSMLTNLATDVRSISPGGPAQTRRSPDSSRGIAEQISANLGRSRRGTFDLKLNPQELGHVRLTLVQHEGGGVLHITAERSDTLDLMRRHIGQLQQDLRELGHDMLTLRFGSSSGGGHSYGQNPNAQTAPSHSTPSRGDTNQMTESRPLETSLLSAPLEESERLDMRL